MGIFHSRAKHANLIQQWGWRAWLQHLVATRRTCLQLRDYLRRRGLSNAEIKRRLKAEKVG